MNDRHAHRSPSARRRHRQRGAVLVEFALVAPLLFVLVLTGSELGMTMRDHLTVSTATRAGARVGASAGVDRHADYDVLRAVGAGLGRVDPADIELIVVFKADGNGQMAPGCKTASQDGLCNRYTAADLVRPIGNFEGIGSCNGGSPDRAWCPLSRERDQASAAGPDWLGVYVQVRRRSLAPGFIGDRSLSHTTVMRLEPRFQP